jgi:magnesium-transporting ATPase (P-type)
VLGQEHVVDDRRGGAATAGEDTDDAHAWHALSAEEVMSRLEADADGLSEGEFARRQGRYGPNQLEQDSGPSPLRILLNQVTSPLIAILVVAGVVASAVGEWVDAGFIGVVLLVNTVLGFVQELRAESSIRSLMELASPTATVVRDGEEQEVAATEVVPGDVHDRSDVAARFRTRPASSEGTVEGRPGHGSLAVATGSGHVLEPSA